MMMRYKIKPEHAAEDEHIGVFQELRDQVPDRLCYASIKLLDGRY